MQCIPVLRQQITHHSPHIHMAMHWLTACQTWLIPQRWTAFSSLYWLLVPQGQCSAGLAGSRLPAQGCSGSQGTQRVTHILLSGQEFKLSRSGWRVCVWRISPPLPSPALPPPPLLSQHQGQQKQEGIEEVDMFILGLRPGSEAWVWAWVWVDRLSPEDHSAATSSPDMYLTDKLNVFLREY